jgi:flagellar protein FlbD
MIHLTRLNGAECVLNADLIEMLESTPDTTITLVSGHKMNVLEPLDEVVQRVIAFRRLLLCGPQVLEGPWEPLEELEPGEEAGPGDGESLAQSDGEER